MNVVNEICDWLSLFCNGLFSSSAFFKKSYKLSYMSSKNGYVNVSTASKKQQSKTDNLYCFIHFPKENTHGVWPQGLIRQKGSFSFEAKYGTKWFECKIEKEGNRRYFEKIIDRIICFRNIG